MLLNDCCNVSLFFTTSIDVLNGTPNVLCALKQNESEFSTPFIKCLYLSENKTDPPKAPSTCNHKSYFFASFDISSILSIHKTVVPDVALI